MRELSFLLFFTCLFFICNIQTSSAALLYFDPSSTSVHRGDSITLALRIDTDTDECINTVDAVINYDPAVRAIDISRGNSILNIWVEDPIIDESTHTIRFAGGIPGGYCGRIPGDPSLTNVLLEIVFRSPGFSINAGDNNNAHIWLADSSQVLLHDGFGTPAQLRLQDANIVLLDTPGTAIVDEWSTEIHEDTDLPSDFTIMLTRDPIAFSNSYFITFNSVDKQSGIDHYEIMEEPFRDFNAFRWGRADAPWIVAESPYVLNDQTLNSTIRVKAIDKAGNERIAVLVPDVALRSLSRDILITIVVVGSVLTIIVLLVGYALWRRKKRTSAEVPTI